MTLEGWACTSLYLRLRMRKYMCAHECMSVYTSLHVCLMTGVHEYISMHVSACICECIVHLYAVSECLHV